MTRINTIDVTLLLDQHLFIEYREITRVATLHRKPDAKNWPTNYTMGTGHVKFFYDKGDYLAKRCQALYDELIKRGYKPTLKQYKTHSVGLHNDWQPDVTDQSTNLARLQSKVYERPGFYKFHGKPASIMHYVDVARSLNVN